MLLRAFLLCLLVVVGCLPQWGIPDFQGTEGRRIQIALEMARSGDWLVPTLGGEPTWAKPPLHYWLLGGMSELFGTNVWSMRLPSVVSIMAAALLAVVLMRRWFGERAAWIAALGVVCSPLVVYQWPSAEIDPLFASLTGMSLWCLATGIARDRRGIVIASGVLGGLALLQKGPPYFLFAIGAYLVWWRRRGLRHALSHFVPLLIVPLAYFVPLWTLRIAPGEMLAVANEETVGRIWTFTWGHVTSIPDFWLRAVLVQMPFVLWCFWEWRGVRDARMDEADLTLRMCSGAAVLSIVLLTFFPGRPTRYILPNVLLFTFAVAPAVAHFASQERQLGSTSRRLLLIIGVAGGLGLVVVPFLPGVGLAVAGLALVAALAPRVVRTPRQLVAFCLVLPVVASWTVGFDRAQRWPEGGKARAEAGRLLRHELDAAGIGADLVTHGHIEAPLLLGADLLPDGDEMARRQPTARWMLHERADTPPPMPKEYEERLRLCVPGQIFVLRERSGAPR
ncbi:MAG: glycosyltransferase family 39 protein [Planctomycetes bacterium]|nr:glycosyltransferase family 39 protein [Planctomycetota bacterium]MCB9886500.1 glycosyltransferase family 39 protein [Planctomycetota bacterium]